MSHHPMPTTLDERDDAILAERTAALDAVDGPRVGDYVDFADGVTRRISYLWPGHAQTSDYGSYYLGNGYVSMSGSLFVPVPTDTLALTDEKRDGAVWFFHHDWAQAHNGIGMTIPFRVFTCPLDAPTS